MAGRTENTLRHVPSDDRTRRGASIASDRGTFVLRDGTPPDAVEPVENGNLHSDCFEDGRAFLHGES